MKIENVYDDGAYPTAAYIFELFFVSGISLGLFRV